MHPDLVHYFYRHHIVAWEREAEVRRLLADGRPKRHFHLAVPTLRRRRPPRTVAATARPCP